MNIQCPTAARPFAALSILKAKNTNDETIRRWELFKKTEMFLRNHTIELVFDDLLDGVVPYGYPFIGNNEEAIRIQSLINKIGMDCTQWPDLPTSVMATALDYYKLIWLINFI